MIENDDPVYFIISPSSPVEVLDRYFKNKHESYKTRGAVGDMVRFEGAFHQGEGTVVKMTETVRSVRAGPVLAIQRWVGGKYWLDEGVIFTAETR